MTPLNGWKRLRCLTLAGLTAVGLVSSLPGCGGPSGPASGAVHPESSENPASAQEGNPDQADSAPTDPSQGFVFPADGVGRELAERLTPPKYAPPPPPPFRTEPEPRSPIPWDRPRDSDLPWPTALPGPRLLPSEIARRDAPRPVLDQSPLSADLHRLPLPTPLWFPVTAKAYAASPDPLALPRSTPAALEQASLSDDATRTLAERQMYADVLPPRVIPAPPSDLGVPDPFALRRYLRLANPLDEATPPGRTTEMPSRELR